MLQYIINATAIWLISIILFDVFLRRESYHNYNRFYLLFTFLLGVLLPLVQWQDAGRPYSGAFQKPVMQVITVKQNLAAMRVAANADIDWQQWLVIIYLLGAAVALCLLVADVVKLLTYYRNGVKSVHDDWTVVATGKDDAPFSFRHVLFISDRSRYTDEEWSIVLLHEARHTILFHLADLLLMQAARIVFWFHPLVYVYNKRLLLVHEYQADNASAGQPQVYGTFLVEQALLQTAPSLSHSFNRSPIKSRIIMLTRTSSKAAGGKTLVFIPLLLVCIFCCSKNSLSQKQKTAKFHILAFGKTDTTGAYTSTNYELALASPKITCMEANCEVISFTVSYMPAKKGGEISGPYTIKGSNRLQGTALLKLKAFKEAQEPKLKIFIDDVKVKRNGIEEAAPGQVFNCTLK